MKFKLLFFLTLILSVISATAEVGIEFASVFVSGRDGYHSYRIPAAVVTSKGTALVFCEGRKNGRADAGAIDLLLKRSTDDGKSWSAQQVVWSDAGNTCGNPAPVIDRDTGFIWLLSTWNDGTDKESAIVDGTSKFPRRIFVTHSEDDGVTWAKPKEITADVKAADWRWYATGPVNGIQLQHGPHTGRLVIPCNHSTANGDSHGNSHSHVIYSDDHGTTWKIGGILDAGTNESTIVELPDGAIMDNARSYRQKKLRAVAISKDSGASWSAVENTKLIEPVCEGSILRYSWATGGDKSRILFSNPASEKRENVTVRISYDEGQTWTAGKSLHAGPSAYSCLTILPDKSIACVFECGEKNAYESITMARIPLSILETTKD